jgi:tetratricopeptide (TPR) repeat protein
VNCKIRIFDADQRVDSYASLTKELPLSLPILILLLTDTALAIVGVILRRRMEGRMRRGFATGLLVVGLAVLCHILGSAPLAIAARGDLMATSDFLNINFMLGFIPAIIYARFFLEAASTGGVEAIFGLDTGVAIDSDFSKAKALERGGNVDEAIAQYRRYFKEAPKSAQALFEIGRLQAKEQRYYDAADTYREISGKFTTDDAVWARASFQLAELLESNLGDQKAGHNLLRQILKRAPKTRHAQFARERLLPKEEQPDHFYRDPE